MVDRQPAVNAQRMDDMDDVVGPVPDREHGRERMVLGMAEIDCPKAPGQKSGMYLQRVLGDHRLVDGEHLALACRGDAVHPCITLVLRYLGNNLRMPLAGNTQRVRELHDDVAA